MDLCVVSSSVPRGCLGVQQSLSKWPVLGHPDADLACPVFVGKVGCDVAVLRFTEARPVPGAGSCMVLGRGSRQEQEAGLDGIREAISSLKTQFILTFVPFLPVRALGTGDLVQQITCPRESFWSHSWR